MASLIILCLIFASISINPFVNADVDAVQFISTPSPILPTSVSFDGTSIDRSPDGTPTAPIIATMATPIIATVSSSADKVGETPMQRANNDQSIITTKPTGLPPPNTASSSSDQGMKNEIVNNLLSSLIPGAGAGNNPIGSLGLLPSLSKLSGPLAHLIVSNGHPSVEDVDQILKALPEMATMLGVASVMNGGAAGAAGGTGGDKFGNIDLTKIPPSLINYVANGGQIPGVSQTDMKVLTQRYLTQMGAGSPTTGSILPGAAGSGTGTGATSINITSTWTKQQVNDMINGVIPLPPINSLPPEYIPIVLSGGSLPGLTMEETQKLKQLYMQQMFSGGSSGTGSGTGGSLLGGAGPLIGNLFANISSSQSISLTKSDSKDHILSELKNIDLSKVPADVIRSVMNGQPPDMNKIPEEVLQSVINNSPQLFGDIVDSELQRRIKGPDNYSVSIDGKRTSDRRSMGALPYDVNSLDRKADISSYEQEDTDRITLWTAVGLGVVGIATIVLIVFLCWRYQRKRKATRVRDAQNKTIPFYDA